VIPAQRRAKILELVQEQGAVSVQELSRVLDISTSTVHRDLDYLSENRYVERTRGGAHRAGHLLSTTFEPDYEIGRHTREREKAAIGRAAVELIPHGASVFLDSSTTVLEAARSLVASRRPMTAITNDLGIAMVLAQCEPIRTIVPGGTVRPRSFTLYGEPGTDLLAGMHVDVALMGIHSLADGDLSDTGLEIMKSKRAVLAACERCVLLADSSKFSARRSFLTIASLADVDALVTDDGITVDDEQGVRDAGVSLHVAKVDA
jgi:DeoR family transcriptional regulator, aga operon transcriptional repressor